MREIEFRGYDESCGLWRYGFHLFDGRLTYISQIIQGKIVRWRVNPNTVGQFTGLLDKNGKKIFEGDVIKCGMRLYACEFIEGGFEFRDLSDSKLVLKAIVNNSCLIDNIHDNPELIKNNIINS